jgi:hypothetical protein
MVFVNLDAQARRAQAIGEVVRSQAPIGEESLGPRLL